MEEGKSNMKNNYKFKAKKYLTGLKFKPVSMTKQMRKTGLGHFRDTDGDGRINILDCRPLNPKLQHARPNWATRQRLKKLPVYVVLESGERVHILSKKAKKEEPEQVEQFLRGIKKQPETLGEIERSSADVLVDPDEMITEKQIKRGTSYRGGKTHPDTIDVYGKQTTKRKEDTRDHPSIKNLPEDERTASTIRHELEHVKQYKKERKLKKENPQAYARYMKGWQGEYEQQKREREAREAERKMISKRSRKTYGARKYATRQFVRTIEGKEPKHHKRERDMGLI